MLENLLGHSVFHGRLLQLIEIALGVDDCLLCFKIDLKAFTREYIFSELVACVETVALQDRGLTQDDVGSEAENLGCFLRICGAAGDGKPCLLILLTIVSANVPE
jgi:hypothetical protein